MKLIIGQTYYLKSYNQIWKPEIVRDSKTVNLKTQYALTLKVNLYKESEQINNNFKSRSEELKPYLKALKQLAKETENRKSFGEHRKSKKEKILIEQISEMKKQLFSKEKVKSYKQFLDVLIRNYEPENMRFSKYPKEGETSAVIYAGKYITVNGKVIHKWYKIEDCVINSDKFDSEYFEEVYNECD
jgi:alkyl hydroperoxide reductase subunit AhpF